MAVETPFVRPGSQAALVEMYRSLLRKSQVPPARAETADVIAPTSINFNFDGVAVAPVPGMVQMGEVPWPCHILSARMYAGNPLGDPAVATATVDLRMGQKGVWSLGSTAIYGTGGMPTLTATVEQDVPITTWAVIELQPGDLLVGALNAFSSTAGATWVVLALLVRRIVPTGIGVTTVVSDGGDTLVDENGNIIGGRS